MRKPRTNPLFNASYNEEIKASIPVEATHISPITKKPMVKVTCGGIPALYDEDSRVVFPLKKS